MRLHDLPCLADESFDLDAAEYLRAEGLRVQSARDAGVLGKTDEEVLAAAHALGAVVLTHDADFGRLAVLGGRPLIGIVYLRPGHIREALTIETLRELLARDPDLTPPFIVVARRSRDQVAIRIRHL